MEDKHIRLTLEFDINASVLQKNNLTAADVCKHIVLSNVDSSIGFLITSNAPGLTVDSASLFQSGTVISKEIIPARSIGDGLDKWRDMVRQEIDLNDEYYGLSTDEVHTLQTNSHVVDALAQHIKQYIVNYDINAYQALDLVFRDEFPDILEEFRNQQGKASLAEQIVSAESKKDLISSDIPFMANAQVR